MQKGWQLGPMKRNVADGYFGAAFFNENTHHLIIAHRGTVPADRETLKNDADIFRGRRPEEYNTAKTFTEEVCMQYADYHVSHTGHSLGAALAELVAYYRK